MFAIQYVFTASFSFQNAQEKVLPVNTIFGPIYCFCMVEFCSHSIFVALGITHDLDNISNVPGF